MASAKGDLHHSGYDLYDEGGREENWEQVM